MPWVLLERGAVGSSFELFQESKGLTLTNPLFLFVASFAFFHFYFC